MIIDIHNHIGEVKGARQTAGELIQHMDETGVDRCVAFTWPQWPDNGYVAQAARQHPDRILPFACVNPYAPAATIELEGLLGEAGFMGLKLHPFLHGYPLDQWELVGPLLEICRSHQVPIIAHGMADNPYTMPLQFGEIAVQFPDVPLIMAHSGFLWGIEQALRVAQRCPNIYLETSVIDATDVILFVSELGPERVIMGTDTPFGFIDLEMQKIERAIADPDARRLVMGGNVQRLLRLPTSA
ncbi:MAG: amidohydrolase family protein [Anaerolineae bacterium]|jgi:predicted TIM-barrel fold metal-dependent hydrolase